MPVSDLDAFKRQISALDQTAVKTLIERRHPEYASNLDQWNFLEATYKGGRAWFNGNIFKYIKEGDIEYAERVLRAYRFNHTRETVELVNKYIFKGVIARRVDDASPAVQAFWTGSTLNRRPVTDFMKLVSSAASTYGRTWVCVDSNLQTPDVTIAQQKAIGARVYAYTIKPQNVLDVGYGPDGDINWIKVSEAYRDDDDLFSTGAMSTRYRIWTKTFWALFDETYDVADKKTVYTLIDSGEHALGRVPIFPVDHMPTDSLYVTTGLIDDIAYLDRTVANYLSNVDAIIQDQTFAQLIMPAQAMLPGDDGQTKILEVGTKRIFTYDGSGGMAPAYIQPDGSSVNSIIGVINKIISEIYHSIGMAGERTKQDNSMGIDNSSGVAKAYDFDRMNAMLAAKARSLEIAENTICELVDTWHGLDVVEGSYNLVSYPDNFDVRGLADELEMASELLLIQAPPMVRQQQMNTVVEKLFPNLGEDAINAMEDQIKTSWPPVEVAPLAVGPNAQVKATSVGAATKVAGTETA